ncbi:MAG TPA: hypothetical protein VHC69_21680 [Polyangiaceae bacterium]|nr:hypothetical protein [Polyangiaceae bacterium]
MLNESVERTLSYVSIAIAATVVGISVVMAAREVPAMRRYLRMRRM